MPAPRVQRDYDEGRTHFDGCASFHTGCAIILLRDVLGALLLAPEDPQTRKDAEKILDITKAWEPPPSRKPKK